MTMPAPQTPNVPDPADGTFTAQLLDALSDPEVERAVLDAYERAEMRQASARGADTSRRARRPE